MRRLALGLLVVLALSGCRDPSRPSASRSPAPSAHRPTSPDRLAPGEVVEGAEQAFGIVLPRSMHVERRFSDEIVAKGPVDPDALAVYIRHRVSGGTLELGRQSIFRGVHVAGDGGDRTLEIRIERAPSNVLLVLRDVTPPAPEPGLSPDQRWQKSGFDRSGKIVDPAQMQ
jgi:hypothetical protein